MKSTVFTCVFAGFLTALATGRCLADSFTFTTIDNPLAQPGNTWVYGISGNTVVGTYFDNLGQYHGFTEANGVFTTLTPPGSTLSHLAYAIGISGNNVVGYYWDNSDVSRGFIE